MQSWIFSIRTTLAYFDQFSHPLSATELWTFLWQPPVDKISWEEFLIILDSAVQENIILVNQGFYCLPGRSSIVESRQRAQVLVEKKLAIARKAAPILGAVPGVQAIFVCNTVAAGWPSVQSDIDLLVVVKPGRLWLTRFLFTITTVLLTKRRHDHQVADHLCLSFYITRDQLNVSTVRGPLPDIYLIYWLQQLFFLVGEQDIPLEVLEANGWIKEYTPHYNAHLFGAAALVKIPVFAKVLKRIGEFFCFTIFETMTRALQKSRIDGKPHAPAPAVVISDTMLKFHEADRREQYQRNWQEKVKELNAKL